MYDQRSQHSAWQGDVQLSSDRRLHACSQCHYSPLQAQLPHQAGKVILIELVSGVTVLRIAVCVRVCVMSVVLGRQIQQDYNLDKYASNSFHTMH